MGAVTSPLTPTPWGRGSERCTDLAPGTQPIQLRVKAGSGQSPKSNSATTENTRCLPTPTSPQLQTRTLQALCGVRRVARSGHGEDTTAKDGLLAPWPGRPLPRRQAEPAPSRTFKDGRPVPADLGRSQCTCPRTTQAAARPVPVRRQASLCPTEL